jgi:hypothetical protein
MKTENHIASFFLEPQEFINPLELTVEAVSEPK